MSVQENFIEFRGFPIPAIGLCYLTITNSNEILQKIVFKNKTTLKEITVNDILTTAPKQVLQAQSVVFHKTIQERPYEDRVKCIQDFLHDEPNPAKSMWAWQLLIYAFETFTGVSLLFHLNTILSFSAGWVWPCCNSEILSEKDPICFTSIWFTEIAAFVFIQALRNAIIDADIISINSFWFAGCTLFRGIFLVNGGRNDYGIYHTNLNLYCPPTLAPKCTRDNLIQLVTTYTLLVNEYTLLSNAEYLEK